MKKIYKLSSPQKSILSMEEFYPNTSINTIAAKINIHEKVDFSLLQKSICLFVQNTNNIRYQLKKTPKETIQYEKKYEPLKIDHFKINEQNQKSICNSIATKSFNLYDSPLYYFATYENADLTGGFFICAHHVIIDAWAISLLISSITSFYSKLKKNENIHIDKNNFFPYSDFIEQDINYLQSLKFEQDKTFWNEVFEENIFEKCSFQSLLASNSIEAKRAEFRLSKKLTSKITNFCKEIKVSPFTFLLFVMGIYESKIKQNNSVVLSTPILNRSSIKDKNTFGLFINNILFKLDIIESNSFIDSINEIKKVQFSYLRHQKYPMQNLTADLKNKFNIKESLYDTSVSFQNARTNHCEDNINYETEWLFNGASLIPLVFHIYDLDDTNRFSFIYDYQKNCNDYNQIKDMHNRLLYICEQIIENPNILMKDIELVTENEKNKLLNDFNQTFVKYNKNKTIVDLWKKQVKLNANKTAIICAEQKYSYSELDKLSNQFAYILQNKYNVVKNCTISVILNRSIELIVAILSILKCGCTYVLIDPSHPQDRKEYMLKNSDSDYAISDMPLDFKNTIVFDGSIPIDTPTNYIKPNISSKDPMYLLYTSGSTGNPKAVIITHRNFHNYLIGISNIINYSKEKTVLSMASISFDVFGYELWVTILQGLTLILSTNEEQSNFIKLNNLIAKYNVNILYGTPSKIQSLMSTPSIKNSFSTVSDIGIGGESFTTSFINDLRHITSANLYNMYGPTETTVGCCCKKIERKTKLITIGKPLANVRFYVLDKNLKLCPPGIKGELYIAGDGVAKGYYNKPELTQKNFISDIFYPNSMMYRSGDTVSWTNKGELLFYGRIDSQIKIRGYRIELQEIERALSEHTFIKNCCVIKITSNGRDFLCAYYTSDFTIQNYELKLFLSNKLPSYMLPSYFIHIDNLPLTINGKIDKTQLPSPFGVRQAQKYTKPENALQKKICNALENCLSIKNLSIDEDFDNLGLDSLSIVKIQSQLSTLNISIPTQYFYDYSNVKNLCLALEHIDKQKDNNVIHENYSFLKHDLTKINPQNKNFKNILLTGATGFFGIHILENLLSKNCKIFCLVRSSNNESAKKRLINIFEFYFKDKYTSDFLLSKLEIIAGDIKYKNLGLSEETIHFLGNNIDSVIHCAALVKHIGKYEDFKKMNLDGTKNVASFCMKYHIPLNHVSTTSVSGDFMPLTTTSDNVNFTEECFYIGQNYNSNYYVKSKLLTEEFLLNQMKEGNLKANIFRVGNLTGRYSDGVFQYNIGSNSFYQKLQFILKNQIFYKCGKLQEFDLSPVDEIAKALVTIVYNYDTNNKIFHLMSPQKFIMENLINKLNFLENNIKILDDDEFYKKIIKMDLDTNSFIISDYNLHINIPNLNIKTNCDITLQYLNTAGFNYHKINLYYIKRIINYIKSINFI